MIPNIYIHEQLARERRQALLREAEQKRRLARAHNAPPLHWLHHFAARLGGYLRAVGTRLQRAQAVK